MNNLVTTAAKATRPILCFLLVFLSGCFSLSRGAPSQQHYVLGPGSQDEDTSALEPPAIDLPVIGLRPPGLAGYLENPFIVVRQGTHRIAFSEFDRWGEDLARGITRTLTRHIAARSSDYRVESVPWPPSIRPDYLIELDLQRFEGVAPEVPSAGTGFAHLLARWEILDSGDEGVLASGTTDVRSDGWTVGDFDQLVGLLDAALGTLAEDLLLGLETARATTDGAGTP